MNHPSSKLVCAAAVLTLGFTAVAGTIYDNSGFYNGNLLQMGDGLTVGNEITMSANTWTLTNFSLEYYTPNVTLNSSLGVDVRFYMNNGALSGGYPTPGTLFYDSGWFYNNPVGTIQANGAHTINYSGADFYGSPTPLTITMPGDFTFTITFANFGSPTPNTIDLPLANNTPGGSYGDYWLYNSGSSQWTLMTNTVPANFVVDFSGTPEPSVAGLGAIGSLLLLGASKLKRKS